MDVSLYSYWRSSCSWRVRIVLAHKNIDYTTIPIHLLQQKNVAPEYLEINPMGQVPALTYNNFTLFQSLAIIHYIELKHPEHSLLPACLEDQARVWEICEIINSGIQPLQNLPILELAEKAGISRKEWAQKVISEGLEAIEMILVHTAGTYCVGDSVSLADVCLVPQVYNAVRFEVDLGPFPNVSRINELCLTLSAFQKAHPSNQPDADT
jgi:maleylacetoacetate isomerase